MIPSISFATDDVNGPSEEVQEEEINYDDEEIFELESLDDILESDDDDVDPGVEVEETSLETDPIGEDIELGLPDDSDFQDPDEGEEDINSGEIFDDSTEYNVDEPEDDEDNEEGYEDSDELVEEEDPSGTPEELGASGASLNIATKATVGVGYTKKLAISHKGKAKKYTIKVIDKNVCTAKFTDNSKRVSITGKKSGSTYITVKLKGGFLNLSTLDKKNIKVYVPKVATSESSITVSKGGAKSIKFSFSNCPETVKAKWQTTNKTLFSGSWGKWSGNSITLTIKGKKTGSAYLEILLINSKTGEIYGKKRISVIVSSQPNVKFSAAKYNLNTGSSVTAKVSYSNLTERAKLTVSNTNSNAFSLTWGAASGQTRALNITGKKKGTGTVTVYLKSIKTGKTLAKASTTVNVSQSPKVTVASSNVTVNTGATVKVKCTASGVSGKYSFGCSPGTTSKFTTSWGKRSNNSNTLSIKGLNAGTDKVTVYIKNSSGKKISTATISIKVNNAAQPAISLSKSSLRINKGRSDLIKTTLTNMPAGDKKIHVSWSDSSVCTCNPDWSGRYPVVSIHGKNTGSCKVTISIIQKATNKTLATATASVNVTITDRINVISYSKNNHEISTAVGFPSQKVCRYMFAGRNADTIFNYFKWKYEKGSRGNCYGISTTAGLLYSPNNIYPSNFNSSVSVTQKLALTHKNSSWGLSVGEWIQAMQISQLSTMCKKYSADINSIVNAVKSDINNNRATTLSLKWNHEGNQKGHAVLAYAFEKVSGSQDRIYIYDSNAPLRTQYIYLTKNNNNYTDWTYSYQYDNKTLRKNNARLLYNLYSNYSGLWSMHGSIKANGKLNADLTDCNLASVNSDSFVVQDVEDNIIATVTDGELRTTDERISIADVDDYVEGMEDSNGVFIYLPIDVYEFENKETNDEPFIVEMSNLDLSTHVETTGNEITLCADDSSDFASAVLDTNLGDEYQITLGSNREGEPEEVKWDGVATGDTVSIMLSNGNLETCNLEGAQLTIGEDNDGGQKEKIYIVNATAEEGGTINPEGDDPVWEGEDQQYLISPNAGYVIKDVIVDEQSVGPVDTYTIENVNENHRINAVFEKDSNPIDIGKGKIEGVVSQVYNGETIKQTPVVTVEGKILSEYTDYEVSYKNNKNVGTATMTITGEGNYTGTITKDFQINPTGTKFVKCSGGTKKVALKWKKQPTQTTGYQVRYSKKKNFKSGVKKVTVKNTKTTKKVIKKLKKGKKYYFQIRTYKKVGNQYFYSEWSKAKVVKVK